MVRANDNFSNDNFSNDNFSNGNFSNGNFSNGNFSNDNSTNDNSTTNLTRLACAGSILLSKLCMEWIIVCDHFGAHGSGGNSYTPTTPESWWRINNSCAPTAGHV